MFELADALTKVHVRQKKGGEEYSLQVVLEASKKAVLQGSMDVLLVIQMLLKMYLFMHWGVIGTFIPLVKDIISNYCPWTLDIFLLDVLIKHAICACVCISLSPNYFGKCCFNMCGFDVHDTLWFLNIDFNYLVIT